MKKKVLLFVLLGILTTCFFAVLILSNLQGVIANEKEQAHFDVYREKAKTYIQSDPEMINRYGNAMTVKFVGSYTYKEIGERTFLDTLSDTFFPRVPDTIEAFTEKLEYITFTVEINGDLYKITFEKNSDGELAVSNLAEEKQ